MGLKHLILLANITCVSAHVDWSRFTSPYAIVGASISSQKVNPELVLGYDYLFVNMSVVISESPDAYVGVGLFHLIRFQYGVLQNSFKASTTYVFDDEEKKSNSLKYDFNITAYGQRNFNSQTNAFGVGFGINF